MRGRREIFCVLITMSGDNDYDELKVRVLKNLLFIPHPNTL